MSCKIVTFKTNKGKEIPVLEISEEGDKFPFRIGKKKCRMVIANIEEIRKFAEET